MVYALHAVLGLRFAERYRRELVRRGPDFEARLTERLVALGDNADVFAAPHTDARALQFSFDLGNGQDASAAAAARLSDPRVGAACAAAGGAIREQELMFCYFSHVAAALEAALGRAAGDDELRAAVRALVRVEKCAGELAHLSLRVFGPGLALVPQAAAPAGAAAAAAAGPAAAASAAGPAGGPAAPAPSSQSRVLLDSEPSAAAWLLPLVERFRCSRCDVVSLAGVVAVEEMGGPRAAWRAGRRDDELDAYAEPSLLSVQERAALRWLAHCRGQTAFDALPLLAVAPAAAQHERPWLELYASDSARFAQDFGSALTKLSELRFSFPTAAAAAAATQESQQQLQQRRRHALVQSSSSSAAPTEPSPAPTAPVALPGLLGVFEFARAIPACPAFLEQARGEPTALLERVRALTVRNGKVCLDVFRTPSPDAPEGFQLDLGDPVHRACAALAGLADRTVDKFKPSLVPRSLSERDFYLNYFSHLAAIVAGPRARALR
jgi:hypothetical protein